MKSSSAQWTHARADNLVDTPRWLCGARSRAGARRLLSLDILKYIIHGTHVRLCIANLVCALLPHPLAAQIRAGVYRWAGFDLRHGAFLMGNLTMTSDLPGFYRKLTVLGKTVIGDHVTINLDARVHLGGNVSIGPYVKIYTGTHPIGPGSRRRLSTLLMKPVTIEDGCWIGLAAVILPGVTIGHGSIVAAGAVVTTDVPPNSYVEGNPAVVVRALPLGDR